MISLNGNYIWFPNDSQIYKIVCEQLNDHLQSRNYSLAVLSTTPKPLVEYLRYHLMKNKTQTLIQGSRQIRLKKSIHSFLLDGTVCLKTKLGREENRTPGYRVYHYPQCLI